MYPEDLTQQIVSDMIADTRYTWWYDEDEECWYARHTTSDTIIRSEVSRDHALVALHAAMRGGRAVAVTIPMKGAEK